jgi:hypothetical protein
LGENPSPLPPFHEPPILIPPDIRRFPVDANGVADSETSAPDARGAAHFKNTVNLVTVTE